MKKIALFSLLLCGVFVGGTGYAADSQMCSGVSCFSYPNGGNVNRICEEEGLSKNATCTTEGATKAVCMNDVSCAAKQCDDDHILWLTDLSPKRANQWKSQGRCVLKAWLQQQCDDNCGICPNGQKCTINDMDNTSAINVNNNGSYQGKAFYDKHACECRPIQGQPHRDTEEEPQPDPNMCEAFVNIDCANGKTYHEKFLVAESELFDAQGNPLSCDKFQIEIEKHNIKFKKADNTELNWSQIVANKCQELQNNNNNNSGTTPRDNAQEAYNRLRAFFNTGKADVWKDSEGKFNTARLASDLTAGVVLGTVGGVVSGVVIKKKQVEKGFDALHCTVGGQNVADWGDEFMVGISK